MPGRGRVRRHVHRQHHVVRHRSDGMSVPEPPRFPAIDPRNEQVAFDTGAVIYDLLEKDLKPRDVMTREAFENSIRVVLAMGGSTNAALHLLAIAHEADVELELEDFDTLSRTTPYITDLRPAVASSCPTWTRSAVCPSL